MMFLKTLDRILKPRLKIFYFNDSRKQDIKKSFLILDGRFLDVSCVTFYYSNILNIMTVKSYVPTIEELRIGAQELLHDRRKSFSLFYELMLRAYSIRFVRENLFSSMRAQSSISSSSCIIRASQTGYLFINTKYFVIKSVWLIGNLDDVYSIQKKWMNLFQAFNFPIVIEKGDSFCIESLIIGKSVSRLDENVKTYFICQYKNDLNRVLNNCTWVEYDAYLENRIDGLPDEVRNLLHEVRYVKKKCFVPLLPQHGDFQFGNIIFSDDKFTIIDWEASFYGFGLYDFFVLTFNFRRWEFWEDLNFNELCLRLDKEFTFGIDVKVVAIALMIEEYLYRARKPASIVSELNVDKLILAKITDLFRMACEDTIY